MENVEKISLKDWLIKVGRNQFTKETGRSPQTVGRAVKKGLLPSGWFLTTRDWCDANSFDCHEHLFDWSLPKTTNTKKKASTGSEIQESGG